MVLLIVRLSPLTPDWRNVERKDLAHSMFSRLLLAFAAYFVLGAYHNYSTYGATGADLIPYVLHSFITLCPLTFNRPFVGLCPDIETSGEKYHTSYETSPRISVRQYGLLHGTDISQSNFYISVFLKHAPFSAAIFDAISLRFFFHVCSFFL